MVERFPVARPTKDNTEKNSTLDLKRRLYIQTNFSKVLYGLPVLHQMFGSFNKIELRIILFRYQVRVQTSTRACMWWTAPLLLAHWVSIPQWPSHASRNAVWGFWPEEKAGRLITKSFVLWVRGWRRANCRNSCRYSCFVLVHSSFPSHTSTVSSK